MEKSTHKGVCCEVWGHGTTLESDPSQFGALRLFYEKSSELKPSSIVWRLGSWIKPLSGCCISDFHISHDLLLEIKATFTLRLVLSIKGLMKNAPIGFKNSISRYVVNYSFIVHVGCIYVFGDMDTKYTKNVTNRITWFVHKGTAIMIIRC